MVEQREHIEREAERGVEGRGRTKTLWSTNGEVTTTTTTRNKHAKLEQVSLLVLITNKAT